MWMYYYDFIFIIQGLCILAYDFCGFVYSDFSHILLFMGYPVIQLKTGREASVGFRHPWIFSGALESIPSDIVPGALVHIADRNSRVIATGIYEGTNIAVRVFDFSQTIIDEAWITQALEQAHSRRLLVGYGPGTDTTGYRVVFGEADGLPGLVMDRYADVLVLQVTTAGMQQLLPLVIRACKKLFSPSAIIEKTDSDPVIHFGTQDSVVEFLEHGMKFSADVLQGQKTGFFLDQKELRQYVRTYSKDRSVLNLFSYTGATSVAALLGGATRVHNIDESEVALSYCTRHVEMNAIDPKKMTYEQADVFSWLNTNTQTYGMVILDPPALTKTKKEKESAAKAYHFLNRAAMRLVENDGIFVTSSCSHFFSEDDFAYTLRRASVQAGVELDVLHVVRQAPDHPLSVYWPEGLYLKSYICMVRRK